MSDDASDRSDAETAPDADADAGVADGEGGTTAPRSGSGPEATGAETDATDQTDPTESTLATRVAEYDDDLAAEVSALADRVETLEEELADRESTVEDLEGRVKRVQADFQNYKKRAQRKQEQTRERATEDLVSRLAPVRNNLVRALAQDESADIRDGVEATLKEFDRVLEDEGVSVVDPAPGEEVDPTRHEVMMRVASEQPAGTVVDVYQPGYAMGETVLTEAQVTVSDGPAEAGDAGEGPPDADG
jgi:molecular chaperone GrpE